MFPPVRAEGLLDLHGFKRVGVEEVWVKKNRRTACSAGEPGRMPPWATPE